MEGFNQRMMPRRMFLRQVLTLALPIAFQQLMLSLSSCADTLMVTAVGQDELSAVSLATQFQFIFSLFLAALTATEAPITLRRAIWRRC